MSASNTSVGPKKGGGPGGSGFLALRAGFHLTENVFFGPAARAIFGKGSFRPSGGVYLTENVFMGHAARAS